MKCKLCGQQPTSNCDWHQGRCPHLPKINFFKRLSDSRQQPNPTWHRRISFLKSILRILAGMSLCFSEFWIAGIMVIIAELLGILEELV